jgi:hypothetical protein
MMQLGEKNEKKEHGVLSSGFCSKFRHTYVISRAPADWNSLTFSVLDVGAKVFHRRLGSSSTGGITGYLNKKRPSKRSQLMTQILAGRTMFGANHPVVENWTF